jgi:feruloyl esterase
MIVDEGTAHCKVLGTIGAEINFELLLPQSWNNRFVMGGGGGFSGSVQNSARWTVNDGYATSGTDTGHQGNTLKADWALNNMVRQVNFGQLAVHRTAVVSKAIISSYYCSDPIYSYFMGCSRGGGQAMMEAQRYPEDFDGIVSAAPAFNWPAIGAEFIQNTQAIYPDADVNNPVITKSNLALLENLILEQCDEIDGVNDRILNDPRDCKFDFSDLPLCKGNVSTDCFTDEQIEAIKRVYNGIANDQGEIYPGFPLGCENDPGAWLPWITGPLEDIMPLGFPSLQYAFGTEMLKYLIFNDPDWDYTSYDYVNFLEDTRYASAYLDATSTDYGGLKNKGGRMILWHGWNDPALSALATINHYEMVEKQDPNTRDYLRLYLLPGVLHCGGGPGPAEVNWLELIRDWVENGNPPERVVVSKTEEGAEVMTIPVFSYPKKATYDGKGDPNKASSFN